MDDSTVLPEPATCVYCGNKSGQTLAEISEHVLTCLERPEARLLMKIESLELVGDVLLSVIHSLSKVVGEMEGMRTSVWSLYQQAERKWEEVKDLSIEDLTEDLLEVLREETEEAKEESRNTGR